MDTEDPRLMGVQKGAKDEGNPLEQIERLLTCPICLDRYKQPKLLPCQHTFCLPCLDSYVESTGGRPRLKCPECRAEHALALDGGVHALQTNLTLLAFLEIHMEASAANATEMQAYVQRFNLERCRVCEEKAELELCAHCEKKCCFECRTSHADMLKRDLSRLLGQVRRLSARVKEASEGLGRGLEHMQANGEQTRQEIRDYFNRYQRELKRREENFLEQADLFVQNEERLMRTLRDALDVEWNNLQDACLWVDAVLVGERPARDDDLARFKSEFQQGLDYLRSFQPDSEELFAKKLRFSPGDDAAKLPTAIANFGELTVSLPQFANRYLPLEQQYIPRPFRMALESDHYARRDREQPRAAVAADRFGQHHRDDLLEPESAGAQRWRRRRELEEEAWTRLRAEGSPWGATAASSRANSGAVSPLTIEAAPPPTNANAYLMSPASAKSPTPSPFPAVYQRGGGGQPAAAEGPKKAAKPEATKPAAEVKKEVHQQQPKEVPAKVEEATKLVGKKEEAKAKPKEEEQPKPVETIPLEVEEPKEEEELVESPAPASGPISPPVPSQPAAASPLASAPSPASATTRPPTGLPQPKSAAKPLAGQPQPQLPPAKNGPAEGPAATRGRMLMVNGPRAGTPAGGAPRRTTTGGPAAAGGGGGGQQPLAQHPKGQKPPLPARQLSAGDEQQQPKAGAGASRRLMTPTIVAPPKKLANQKKQSSQEKEEEEEEEEEESGSQADQSERKSSRRLQIQSQSKRFRIKCRSSSHGRPAEPRRPSIETGQPIPVVGFPLSGTAQPLCLWFISSGLLPVKNHRRMGRPSSWQRWRGSPAAEPVPDKSRLVRRIGLGSGPIASDGQTTAARGIGG